MFQTILKRELKLLGLLACILFAGCCEPDEYIPKNDAYHRFTQHELMTFVDSAGNYLQLLFNDEGYTAVHDWNSDCDRYDHYPWAKFNFLSPHEGEVKFSQSYGNGSLSFPGFYVGGIPIGDIDTTIQGYHYTDCGFYSRTDSLEEICSIMVDKNYGLIMFSYRDEYRWERVLDW